jgi:hypothetical protein
MQHGHHNQRIFARCICDDVISQRLKSQWPRGEVWARVTPSGKLDKLLNEFTDFFNETISRRQIVSRNVFPNL